MATQVKASSTVGVIAQLLTIRGSGVDRVTADTMPGGVDLELPDRAEPARAADFTA
jgi:hypothetical protein